MLLNVKSRLHEGEIQQLIGYSVFPDPILYKKPSVIMKIMKTHGYLPMSQRAYLLGLSALI